MGLINKDNIKKVKRWPNPYRLKKEDADGKLKGYPLEVITLILFTLKYLRPEWKLKDVQMLGLNSAFTWADSVEGQKFWKQIFERNFNVFYDKYTPDLLRKRLKDNGAY